MAAIELSGQGAGASGRGYRISTRVDMTPMVDLGFLLITFFMLATTMTKPTAMSLAVPAESDASSPISASGVLTLFLGANDEIYYLDGVAADEDHAVSSLKTLHRGNGLREVIFASQKRAASRLGRELIVVIKPTTHSTYQNMVDVLDEMAITKSKRYALVDKLTSSEKKLLNDKISNRK